MNKKQAIRINESQLRKIIKESVFMIMSLNESSGNLQTKNRLNEAVKSRKFANAIKKHGGLANGRWSSLFGNDLYNMTDDDFDDYVVVDNDTHYKRYGINGFDNPNGYNNDNFKPIYFKDGTFMVKSNPSIKHDDREAAMIAKRDERRNSRSNDGAKSYQYENPYLNQLINQDDLGMAPRGKWGFPNEKGIDKTNLNMQALRQKHGFNTKGDDKNRSIVGKAKDARKRSDNTQNIGESRLKRIVKESVRMVLRESEESNSGSRYVDGHGLLPGTHGDY